MTIEFTEEMINQMVSRFLCWKLPQDFGPDCGIEFTPPKSDDPSWWPIGTNLLTADQAKEMIMHLVAGLESDEVVSQDPKTGKGALLWEAQRLRTKAGLLETLASEIGELGTEADFSLRMLVARATHTTLV